MEQPSDSSTPRCANCNASNEKEHQLESESIVSDRCWVPQFKSDSRKWILRDGHTQNVHTQQISTMKDSYGYPQEEDHPALGKRAKIMLERMRHEAEAEALAERAHQPTNEKYITTYDDTFCPSDPNFEPSAPPRQRDLYEKYPLYGNPGASYWMFQHEKHVAARPSVGGAAMKVDFGSPFKRKSHFDATEGH